MKKLLLTMLVATSSFSAMAVVGPFGILEPAEVVVERPLFDNYYTEIQEKTLNGDAQAYMEGALRYYYGYSKRLDMQTSKDYATALRWFHEAALKGNVEAKYFLGMMYLKGQGVTAEYKEAINWLTQAAAAEDMNARYMLGNVFYQMSQDPRFPDSYKEYYFEQAKKQYQDLDRTSAYPRALYNLAYITLTTEDITRFTKAKANELLLRANTGFIIDKDQENSYEVLKLMKLYKLAGYQQAEDLFNNNFDANYKKSKNTFEVMPQGFTDLTK